jgi:nitroimidazol reductase NimA-like FMN-containing flavoprotein (pyridoxamine 5'-phosphate oxidase superfamily)
VRKVEACSSSMQRAKNEILDKKEIEEILTHATIGRLGTCANGEPYVVPLIFAYNNGKIVFHCSKKGKKLNNIVENSRVCFEVDSGMIIPNEKACGFSVNYKSVIAYGNAIIQNDPHKMLEALRQLTEKYASKEAGNQLTLDIVSSYDSLAVVEIKVHDMKGKKNPS